ncbi:MAG: hypothetical protein BA066_04510 [Candidatus Korarchaeota archaeon NZ13-K]|nr:MAG: hypothetical protein BA066_04510 [Candidatus Korarchaeota archaeon NZ13-K]
MRARSSGYPEGAERPSLDELILLPPQFTPGRFWRGMELLREPSQEEVITETSIGGFRARIPVVCSLTWLRDPMSLEIARGCAEMGAPLSLAIAPEGHDEKSGLPSFKEIALAHLESMKGLGGLVVRQAPEDGVRLWERVYTDPDLDPYVDEGLLAFEISALAGSVRPSNLEAPELPIPRTMTEEVLAGRIRSIRNNFPRVRVFLRTGPYRDLDRVIEIAGREGADAVTIEAGAIGAGLPLIACLGAVVRARERGVRMSLIISSELRDCSQIAKSLALGASAVELSEALRKACLSGQSSGLRRILGSSTQLRGCAAGVVSYLRELERGLKVIAFALGKCGLDELSSEDLGALDRDLAELLGVSYVYGLRGMEGLGLRGATSPAQSSPPASSPQSAR